ncbi:MAG: ribonuclease HIII [Anaerolineae bacterium]|nr:ribonuclease HIII [Anaerolineae bacterium]
MADTLAALKDFVEQNGWRLVEEKTIPYGQQFRISDGRQEAAVNLYTTGRALVQGKASPLKSALETWWAGLGAAPTKSKTAARPTATGLARIGSDETGKGDYFGPLVIGAVFVDGRTEEILLTLGVRDSKSLSENQINQMAKDIKAACPHSVVVINPEKYNEMYGRFQNINRLLAWGHARAIENVLETVACDRVVVDQFAKNEDVLGQALREKGKTLTVEQRVRAESDAAVAAAAIVARAEWLIRMKKLSSQFGVTLPAGASDPRLIAVGRQIVREHGQAALAQAAKLHFRTTQGIFDVE